MEKGESFQQIGLELLGVHKQRNKLCPISHTYTKINSKLIIHLNLQPKTMKLLGENFGDLVLDNGFLGMTPKA